MSTQSYAPKHGDSIKEKKHYTVANSLVNYYLAIMFSFFPLFLTDKYSHARRDKLWFYLIATGILIVSVGICMFISRAESARLGMKKPLILPLSVTDIFMLFFIGLAAVSTVFSVYPTDAFFGTAGRNNGLLLMLMYTLMYFIITRNYVRKDYVFVIYLVFSSVVALLAVLNFFNIDPVGLLDGYDESTVANFGSTIGNKNIIATFMCIFLPIAVMLFVVSEKMILRIVSGAAIIFAYTGLLCADSTSDILGLLVILPLMAIFSARSILYLRRYLLALTILFLSGKLLLLFATLIGNDSKGFEFMQEFLIYHPLTYVPIAVCGIAYLVMLVLSRNGALRYPAKAVQAVLIALFLIGTVGALSLFVYFSFFDRTTDLGEFAKLLRFDDYWGTHRGFMWRVSFEEYGNFGLFGKLFGSGPDTVYYVLTPHFAELSARFNNTSTDCVHNEFINYLLSQGALGLTAYLGVMISAVVRSLKTAKRDPMALVFISTVLCYLAQSVVNLYNPIVTPLLFIFLSLSEATCRNSTSQQSLS